MAAEFDLPLLGRLPLSPSIRESGETGELIVHEENNETDAAFASLADETMDGFGGILRRSHRRAAKQ